MNDEYLNPPKNCKDVEDYIVNVPYLTLKLNAAKTVLDRISPLATVGKVNLSDNPDAIEDPFEGLGDEITGVKIAPDPEPPPEDPTDGV